MKSKKDVFRRIFFNTNSGLALIRTKKQADLARCL